jgi:hypothetical protein
VDPDGAGRSELAGRVAARIGDGRAAEWEGRLTEAGLPAAVAAQDLDRLPLDPVLSGLFEPVASTCRVPASPWSVAS